MENQRKTGVILSYAYSFAQIVVSLLYVPILLNGIGASEYGLYQLVGSTMAYMTIMNSMFASGVTRFYCKYFAKNDILGMENVLAISRSIYRAASIVALIAGFALSILLNRVYNHQLSEFQLIELSIMVFILVANLIITMNNTINVAVINANERFVFLKITQLLTAVLQPILVIFVIKYYPQALSICLVQLIMNVICALAQRIFARSILGARVQKHVGRTGLLRELLLFSSSILLASIADQIFWKTNQLILGFYFGTSVVAIYAVAFQICTVYMSIGTAFSSIFQPKISSIYFGQKDIPKISELFTKIGRLALYPLLAILLGFAVFGKEFIVLWVGETYVEAYLIALVIMIPFTIDLAQNIGLVILQTVNKYHFRGIVYLVIAILNTVLVVTFAQVIGAVGAAMISAACMLVGNGIVINIYYKKVIKLDMGTYWRNSLRVACPIIAFAGSCWLIKNALDIVVVSWIELAIYSSIFAALFFLVSYAFSMNGYERSLIKQVFKKIAK